MQANHQGIVKPIQLFGLGAHHGRRRRGHGLAGRTRHLGRNLVFGSGHIGGNATQVAQVVFEVHILSKPKGYCTQGKSRKGKILEEAKDFSFVPGPGQQRIIRSLRDTTHALYQYRQEQHRSQHTEQHAHRGHHSEFVETTEMRRKQRKEGGNRRKARQDKRFKHPALGCFQDFFQSRELAHQLLRSSQDMDRIVDTDTENNRRDKHRERVQLSIKERRKRKCRKAGVKHRSRYENRALHAPKEEYGEEDNKDQTNRKREYGIVRHFVHFLKAFISTFHRESGGYRVSLAAEISEQ